MTSLVFNANDVFEMAKRIERNGIAFYRAAADIMTDEKSRKLMIDLSDMEASHERIFADMQETLAGAEKEDTVYDPHDEAYQFLKGMADRYVFSPSEEPGRAVSVDSGVEAVLREALQREKDSIIFYEGIKVMVPEKYGRSRIDEIIEQEMGHVMLLTRELDKVTSGGCSCR